MSLLGNIAVEGAMEDLLARAEKLRLEKGIVVPPEFISEINEIKASAEAGWY